MEVGDAASRDQQSGPVETRATYFDAKVWQVKQAEAERARKDEIKRKKANLTMEDRVAMALKWQEVTGVELPEVESDDDLDWDSDFDWDTKPKYLVARLIAKYRDQNPDGMRLPKLQRLVRELPGFVGEKRQVKENENVLLAIQEAWIERHREEVEKVTDDNLSNYEP